MGLMRSAVGVRPVSRSASSGIATPEKWLVDWITGGQDTAAGIGVDVDAALNYGPFFAGVQVIAGDLGSLPLITYQRLERGKRRAVEHPIYPILHDQPNELMTSIGLREMLQGHALTHGGGYANIERDRDGEVVALWPLHPARMRPKIRRDANRRIRLVYRYEDSVNGIYTTLLPDEVLHIAGLGGDGIRGYSIVRLARESIALGIAAERYGGSWFGNGSRPAGVLKYPTELGDPARKRIKADWENMHRGLDNAQRVAILEEGLEWESIGIPPEDAQFLETRKFSVTEMARWFRLPPHKIGDLERSTFSNIESQQLDYVATALRTWLVRWEQMISTRLLSAAERRRYFVEHLLDALLRGDTKTRFEAYAIARNWGWMSADDVLEAENRNPLPDGRGSVYLVPLNMVPAPTPQEAVQLATAEGRAIRARHLARLEPQPGPHPEPAALPPPRDVGVRGRGMEARRRIAEVFKPLIRDADTRLAKLERAEVASLVRRHLDEERARPGRSVDTLKPELEELYRGLISERSLAAWLPIFTAFAAEIAADAAADVGHTGEISLDRWGAAYVQGHLAYRVASALGQLWRALAGEKPAEQVTTLMDTWVEKRPDRTARWEGNQLPNAAARETWREAGVRTLKWVTQGDTCPFCTGLDGIVVGIDEPFVAAGGEVSGLEDKLKVDRNTFHPPLHPGCDCQVVPA